MNISAWWRMALVLAALFALAPAVRAQGMNMSTLEKIREYGTIYVGHRETSIPFSYFAGDAVVGYSMDLCDRIVDAIKTELGDPSLKVVLVPLTSSNRLWMLMTGVIDLECGFTANTRIRQQSIAFAPTTFVAGIKALVRKDSGIERIADLDGKVVVTTAGTATERIVKTVLAARNALARDKRGRDHPDSFSMVLSRQADAFVLDDVLLSGLLANSPDADKLKLLEENFGFEPYAIGLRKDDPEFEKLVDATVIGMMKNGDVEKLYTKWFMSPIPPKNINLQIPMSDLLKHLLLNPSKEGN